MHYTEQKTCRICGRALKIVLDFGEIYPSAFVTGELDEPFYSTAPLTLARCTECGLIQLAHTVDLDSMYRTYYYQSGINSSMVAALKNIVDEAMKLVELGDPPDNVVCDIACNDGTLLSFYPEHLIRVGFDPALNLPKLTHINVHVQNYFSAEQFPFATVKAKIVTSIAMFYDLPDPMKFTLDVASILHEDGVWIMQLNDLKSMLELTAFDAVCHEHLEYYRVDDIIDLMRPAGLQVFRIEHNDVNGGSLRFYIGHRGKRPVEDSVTDYLFRDRHFLETESGSLEAFAERVSHAQKVLVGWLRETVNMGYKVYGLAASTKGNTLLQYFGINTELIAAIADLNPDKFGRKTVGTHIPIIPESEALAEHPDYFLVLAWGFLPFFLKSMKPFMEQGGALVVPLPEPKAYFMANGELISAPLEWKLVSDGD